MSKKRIYTFAGILVAVLFAFGGLFLTNRLFDLQEEKFLSSTEKIQAGKSFSLEEETELYKEVDIEDLEQAVSAFYTFGYGRPHDPVEEQLDMKGALDVSYDLLNKLEEEQVTAAAYTDMEESRATAILYNCGRYDEEMQGSMETGSDIDLSEDEAENIRKELEEEYVALYGDYEQQEIMLSFWEVQLINESVQVTFRIHAYSGTVWYLFFQDLQGEELIVDSDQLLDVYLKHIGLWDTYVKAGADMELYENSTGLMRGYWSYNLLSYVYEGDFDMEGVRSISNYEDEISWMDKENPYNITVGLIPGYTPGIYY